MKEGKSNDPLERFLQESFRDFGDNPPDSVWDSIHDGMSDVDAKDHRERPSMNRRLGLLCLLLIFFAAGQYFFYKTKIDKLSDRVVLIEEESELESKSKLKSKSKLELKSELEQELDLNSMVNSGFGTSISEVESINPGLKNNNKSQRTISAEISTSQKHTLLESTEIDQMNNTVLPDTKIYASNQLTNSQGNDSKLPETPSVLKPNSEEETRSKKVVAKIATMNSMDVSNLSFNLDELGFKLPDHKIYFPSGEFIKPNRPLGKFSLSLHSLFVKEWGLMNSGNNEGSGYRVNETLSVGEGNMTGLLLNYNLSHRWNVQFGLSYRQYRFVSTHDANLRFKYGAINSSGNSSGSSGNTEPEPGVDIEKVGFNYQFNTFSGAADVSFVLRPDNTMDLPDGDLEIKAAIEIKQTVKTITIPLLVNYRLKKRKEIYPSFRAGVLTNFVTTHHYSLESLNLQNEDFMVKMDSDPTAELAESYNISLDYLLGIGLNYEFLPQFNFSLEPTLIGSFSPFSRQYALGVNGWITYDF